VSRDGLAAHVLSLGLAPGQSRRCPVTAIMLKIIIIACHGGLYSII
jgi:hypothetical protein